MRPTTDEKPGQGDRRAVERQATTQLTTLTSLLAGFGFLWFTSLVDKELYAVFARGPRRDGVDDLCARARFDCRGAARFRGFRDRAAEEAEPSDMVEGFDNIGVCVTNLQSSVAFYELLGLREAYRNERGVLMAAGDARLFLFATRRADPPPVGRQLGLFENPPGIDHISFTVADVDGVYAKLSAAGVKFDGAPQDQSWGARMVGLKDPDGNNLYLLQKL